MLLQWLFSSHKCGVKGVIGLRAGNLQLCEPLVLYMFLNSLLRLMCVGAGGFLLWAALSRGIKFQINILMAPSLMQISSRQRLLNFSMPPFVSQMDVLDRLGGGPHGEQQREDKESLDGWFSSPSVPDQQDRAVA